MTLGQAPELAQLIVSSTEPVMLRAWYLSESPAIVPLETRK